MKKKLVLFAIIILILLGGTAVGERILLKPYNTLKEYTRVLSGNGYFTLNAHEWKAEGEKAGRQLHGTVYRLPSEEPDDDNSALGIEFYYDHSRGLLLNFGDVCSAYGVETKLLENRFTGFLTDKYVSVTQVQEIVGMKNGNSDMDFQNIMTILDYFEGEKKSASRLSITKKKQMDSSGYCFDVNLKDGSDATGICIWIPQKKDTEVFQLSFAVDEDRIYDLEYRPTDEIYVEIPDDRQMSDTTVKVLKAVYSVYEYVTK